MEYIRQVSPALNGDTRTRLFGFFKSQVMKDEGLFFKICFSIELFQMLFVQSNGGCFNLLCGGFIQVNQECPIDVAFNNTSTYGGRTYVIPLLIFKVSK